MNPARFSQMMKYLTRAKKADPDLPDVFPASEAPIPPKTKNVEETEAVNQFMLRNPRVEKAGGGRIGFKDGPAVKFDNTRDKIPTGEFIGEGRDKSQIFKIKNNKTGSVRYTTTGAGGGTKKLYNSIEEVKKAKLDFIPDELVKTDAKRIKENIQEVTYKNKKTGKITTKYKPFIGPDKVTIPGQGANTLKEAEKFVANYFKENPKQIRVRDPKKNYASKDVRKKVLEETDRTKAAGTKKYNYHHIRQIAGGVPLTTDDVMIINQRINSKIGGKFNESLNRISTAIQKNNKLALEAMNNKQEGLALDYMKRSDELNAQSEKIVNSAIDDLPEKYKSYVGFNKFTLPRDEYGLPISNEPMIIKKVGGMPVSKDAIDLTTLDLKQEKEFRKIVKAQAESGKTGPIDLNAAKEKFLKNLDNKKFGRVADVIVKASKEGGFGDIMQSYCLRKQAKKGGRMFLSSGSGCPAAKDDPKGFLKTISEDPRLAKFLKSGPGKKAAALAARVSGNVLNPTTWIGGEVAYVLAEGLNNFASGLDLAESFDRAFTFGDFEKFEKNLVNQAKELGYDDNQLNLLQETININKLDNRQKKLEYGLDVEEQDPSSLTSDATMGFEDRLVNTNKNLDQSVDNYLNILDKMGFDLSKEESYDTGVNYLDNVFKKRTQNQLTETFDQRKDQIDPTQTPFGNFISPVFDLGSYTQPLKYAFDVVNPFTKDVPFLSERQQEAKKLREMSKEELDAYNKERGFTLENIEQGTAPQIRPLMNYLGTNVTGQGFGSQFLAGGGIAKIAGIDQGPPPVKGPNSQGLQGLLKRGIKI